MKKLFMTFTLLLALCFSSVTNAQVNDYLFTTGVDTTQWIDLSSNAQDTTITTANGDSFRTQLLNIGFTFTFAGTSYTQFSMNSDGCLRLGSTVTGTSNYSTPFSTANSAANNPKIIGIGRDGRMTGTSNASLGCYLKWETVGTEGSRICVAEFSISSYTSPYTVSKWQVQLYEGTNQIKIVYGSEIPTSICSTGFQVGMCKDATDVATINTANHTVSYGATTTLNTSTTLPEKGRYYQFNVPSCPSVADITSSNITTTSADLSWTAGGTESSWEVVVSDTVISDFSTVTGTTVNTPSFQATNLNHSTTYIAYVRALCSSSDMSNWAAFQFLTACDLITSFPWTENFDSYTGTTSSTGANNLPVCWSNENTGTSYSNYPIIYSTASYAQSPSNSVRFYIGGSSTIYQPQIAILPEMANLNNLQLTINARCGSATYTSTSRLAIGVAEGNGVYTWIDTLDVNLITYQTFEIPFSSYQGTGNRIAICGIKPATSYCNINIDDLEVYPIPTCIRPNNVHLASIASTEATLAWTERGTATSWIVKYDTVDFDVYDNNYTGYQTEWVSNDTNVTLSNLEPNTVYYCYVMSDCGNEQSMATSFTFRTTCAPIDSLPYSYGFEDAAGSGATYAINSCWHKGTNNATAYPYPSSTSPHSGSKCLYFFANTSYYSYAVLPAFEESVQGLILTFWNRSSSTTNTGTVEVGVMTNPSDISTFQLVQTCTPNSNTWTEQSVGFSSYQGNGAYIAFRVPISAANYCYLDDVTVELAPSCPSATNVEVSNIAGASAVLTWDYMHGVSDEVPSSFNVELNASDGSNISFNGVSSPLVLTGLQPGTAYTAVVTSDCSGLYGNPDSVAFTTSCLSGGSVDIVGGTPSNNYSIPVNNFYNYSFSQELILASEIGAVDSIFGVAYESDATTTGTIANCTVYVANTDMTSISTTAHVPADSLVQVFTGTLNFANGWNQITFDSVFVRDPQKNLVIAIDKNTGSYLSSTATYKTHAATGMAWAWYSDSGNPTPSAANGASSINYSYRNNMRLISPCNNDVTCVAPNLFIDSVSGTEAGFSWAPGLNETSWDVDYKVATASEWTSAAIATSSTDIVISNLTPNTTYTVRVGAICSGDEVYAIASFTTPCMGMNIPFSENFDTWTASSTASIDPCWYRASNYSTTSTYPYVSSTYGNALYMYSSSTTHTYICLPQMNVAIDSLQVSFSLYRSNSTYTHNLKVGVMTDPTDFNTFTEVATVHPAGVSVWENFEVNLNTYTGNGRYIAFVSPNGEYSYPYLDNIMVDRIPTCPRPSNITATGITQNGATVHWTGNAQTYQVQYGVSGYTLGEGTIVDVNDADSVVLNGLSSSTNYVVYVRAICNDDDTSAWSFGEHFVTQCGTIDNLPYTENFEDWGTGTTAMPACWNRLSSTASRPYIYATSSYALNGTGHCLYFYASGTTGYCYAVMPPTSHQIDSLQVSFWARQWSTSYNCSLVVGVMTNPYDTSTFVALDTVTPTVGTIDYQYFEVPLSNYTDTGRYIAFSSIISSGSSNYIALDQVELDYIPTCLRPTALAGQNGLSTSTQVTWTEMGQATQWEVQYAAADANLNQGTTLVASTNPFTISNLTPSTQYQFRVRSICGVGDTSRWSNEIGYFGTAQSNPATVPYTYDFEDSTEYANWDRVSNNTVVWTRGAAGQSSLDTGSYGMFVSGNGVDATFVSGVNNVTMWRDVNFGNDTATFNLTFDATMGGNTASRTDGLKVIVLDPGQGVRVSSTAITTPWGSVNNTDIMDATVATVRYTDLDSTGAWGRFTASIDNVCGIKRIAFFWFNQSTMTGDMAKVDNISIEEVLCARPTDLAVDNVTTTSADLTWNGEATGNYILTWRPYPDGTNTEVAVSGNSYQLTGLTAATRYAYWVRTLCSVGDTSDYSDGIAFWTECGTIDNLPWNENFDGITTVQTAATGVQPTCWTMAHVDAATMGTTQMPQLYWSSTYATSGSYCLRLYYRGIYALPQMGHDVDSLMMTFNVRQSSTAYRLVVGVLDSITEGCEASFVPIDTIICSSTSTSEPQTVYFANYAGNGRYIAFRNIYNTTTGTIYDYSYNYIDDIVVDYMPSCMPVRDVHIDPLLTTTSSITLDWTDLGSAASQYEIAYNTSAFTPGTGVGQSVIVNAHPATVNNLSAASTYQFYVRPICSAGDTAIWSASASGATGCDIIEVSVNNPYIENFDAVTGTTYSTQGQLPACWDAYSNGTSAAYLPHVIGSGSYWYSPNSTNSLVMTSGSATYGDVKYVRLPEFTGSVNELTLDFWYRNESATSGTLSVGYFTNALLDTSFVPVQTMSNTTTGSYASVSFAEAPDSAQYIGFKWVYTTSYYSVCIDTVTVTSTNTGVACHQPTDLSFSNVDYQAATISWIGDGNSYEVEIKAAAQGDWADNPTPVQGYTYTFSGLIPATEYQVRVRQNCDTLGYSDWAIAAFTTDSLPCLAPTNLVADPAGTSAQLSWTPASNESQWMVMVWNNTMADSMIVNAASSVVNGLISGNTYNAAVKAVCGNGAVQSDWSDTITFTTVECEPVTGVQATNLTQNSATISWTNNAQGATQWRVEYGEAGYATGEETVVMVSQNPYTINGLDANTQYEVNVTAICGDQWISVPSSSVTFSTEAAGIESIDGINVTIYPNPAQGMTTISLTGVEGQVELTIVDMSGRRVMSETVECASADCVKTINVESLAQGAYFVRINGENTNMVKKLIVK